MAHPGGRPLKFKSAQEILDKAQEYFDITPPKHQTITGLAIALDTSRETLINYENRDEFFDAIKKCKDRVEHAYELSLRERGSAGDIFGLKNFGWKDKQEQEINLTNNTQEILKKYGLGENYEDDNDRKDDGAVQDPSKDQT